MERPSVLPPKLQIDHRNHHTSLSLRPPETCLPCGNSTSPSPPRTVHAHDDDNSPGMDIQIHGFTRRRSIHARIPNDRSIRRIRKTAISRYSLKLQPLEPRNHLPDVYRSASIPRHFGTCRTFTGLAARQHILRQCTDYVE